MRTQRLDGDRAEMFLRLVLLDVIGKSELSAADPGLLVETISRAGQANATCLCWSP